MQLAALGMPVLLQQSGELFVRRQQQGIDSQGLLKGLDCVISIARIRFAHPQEKEVTGNASQFGQLSIPMQSRLVVLSPERELSQHIRCAKIRLFPGSSF